MDAESFRSIPRSIDAPAATQQDGLDVTAHDGVQIFRGGAGSGGRACATLPQRLVELQGVPPRGDHRPLDHVLELAHVTGPRMALQRIHHFLRHIGDRLLPQFTLVTLDEKPYQTWNVFESVRQGRQVDRIHI